MIKKYILILCISTTTLLSSLDKHKQTLILNLFDHGIIKFGNFILKSGSISPIYIDLRCLYSYPSLLTQVVHAMLEKTQNIEYHHVAGVPYAAIPYASIFSHIAHKPLLFIRKTIKNHGTQQLIEGLYNYNDHILVLDDLITSGASILELYDVIKEKNLLVKDVIVFLDREQGGKEHLAIHGITVHAVCTITDVLEILYKERKITKQMYNDMKHFITATKVH